MKQCKKCAELKDLSEFNKDKRSKDGLSYWCRKCHNKQKNQWYKDNPEKNWYRNNPEKGKKCSRKTKLKQLYGITPEIYQEMYENQNGICANPGCDNPVEVIDHDHITGKVRGLLCHGCNVSLGYLKEDKSRILGLVEYISS